LGRLDRWPGLRRPETRIYDRRAASARRGDETPPAPFIAALQTFRADSPTPAPISRKAQGWPRDQREKNNAIYINALCHLDNVSGAFEQRPTDHGPMRGNRHKGRRPTSLQLSHSLRLPAAKGSPTAKRYRNVFHKRQ
jgi:hypothetical protein